MSNHILPNVKEPVKDRCKNSHGFTLAELLIVIAIIGVLVAVSIPIFNAQMEKARRAVDLHTARSIESALAAAYNMGDIQLTKDVDGTAKGLSIYVMICRDPAYAPKLCYEVTGVKGHILKTSHSHKQSHLCFSDSIRKEL